MKNQIKFIGIYLFFLLLIQVSFLSAQAERPSSKTLIHEAYLPSITGLMPLEAVPSEPPPAIQERSPPNQNPLALWLPGYWAWVPEEKDFIWISGVWRLPPPGQVWISGYWNASRVGWVYIKGFWSPVDEVDLAYLPQLPPDPIQEEASNPPADNFFWNTGYWAYVPNISDYAWIKGEWLEIDPQWILVPAHYQWREEGIVFVPAFWDWQLEKRGQAYQPTYIAAEDRDEITYEPSERIDPTAVVEQLIAAYPDYLYFYRHYVYFHPDFATQFPLSPPWWKWSNWWTFNWHNQWSAWWWYTHPGYPQPYWINSAISNQLPPPPPALLVSMQRFIPPVIITPVGVVTSNELLRTFSGNRGEHARPILPVLPSEKTQRKQLFTQLQQQIQPPKLILKPNGAVLSAQSNKSTLAALPRPQFKAPNESRINLTPEQLQNVHQQARIHPLPAKPNDTVLRNMQQSVEKWRKVPRKTPPNKNQLISQEEVQRQTEAVNPRPFVQPTPAERMLPVLEQQLIIQQQQMQQETIRQQQIRSQQRIVEQQRAIQQNLNRGSYPTQSAPYHDPNVSPDYPADLQRANSTGRYNPPYTSNEKKIK